MNNYIQLEDLSSIGFKCDDNGKIIPSVNCCVVSVENDDITSVTGNGKHQFVYNSSNELIGYVDIDGNIFSIMSDVSSATNTDNNQGFGVQEIGGHTSDGTTITFSETVVGFIPDPTDPDGPNQIFVAEDGTKYCVPKCIKYISNPVDGTTTTEDCVFQIDLSANGNTPCSITPGNQVYGDTNYGLVFGSGNYQTNGFIVSVDHNGVVTIIIQDCTQAYTGVTFNYNITCPDGSTTEATWTINYTPPPIGDIRLNKDFVPNTSEVGDIVEMQLTVSNVGTGPITSVSVTDQIDITKWQIPTTGGLTQTSTVTGTVSMSPTGLITWDLGTNQLDATGGTNDQYVQSIFLEQIGAFEYCPNLAKAMGDDGVNGPDSTVDYSVDELTNPPTPERKSNIDDSDLDNVVLDFTGSTACDGTLITDPENYCYKTTLFTQQGDRTYDANGVQTSLTYFGSPNEIVTIENCNGVLSFDWVNSFVTDSGDQTLIEAQFSGTANSISANKYLIDDVLVGLTEAEVIVGSGTDYLGTLGYPRKTVNGYDYYEGGEWFYSKAIITDMTGGTCDGVSSAQNDEILPIKKGIKAYYYQRHGVGFWDQNSPDDGFRPVIQWVSSRYPTNLDNPNVFKPNPEPLDYFIQDSSGNIYGNAFTTNARPPYTNNAGSTFTDSGALLLGSNDGKYVLTVENTWADGKTIYAQSIWYIPQIIKVVGARYPNMYTINAMSPLVAFDTYTSLVIRNLAATNVNSPLPAGVTQPFTIPANNLAHPTSLQEYFSNGVLHQTYVNNSAAGYRRYYPSVINIDHEGEIVQTLSASDILASHNPSPPTNAPWNEEDIKTNMVQYIIRTF